MIILDTETTGLRGPEDIAQQPNIIELGLLKLDDKSLKIVDRFDELINPCKPLPMQIAKKRANNITDEQLKDKKPFVAHYQRLIELFIGERMMVAHNLPFDAGMLELELTRIHKLTHFPWPPNWVCTVEVCQEIYHKQIKLQELYTMLTKKECNQSHRAMDDTLVLYEVVKVLRKQGKL